MANQIVTIGHLVAVAVADGQSGNESQLWEGHWTQWSRLPHSVTRIRAQWNKSMDTRRQAAPYLSLCTFLQSTVHQQMMKGDEDLIHKLFIPAFRGELPQIRETQWENEWMNSVLYKETLQCWMSDWKSISLSANRWKKVLPRLECPTNGSVFAYNSNKGNRLFAWTYLPFLAIRSFIHIAGNGLATKQTLFALSAPVTIGCAQLASVPTVNNSISFLQ